MSAPRVTLRPATPADGEALWRWRNDPATRRASFDEREIPWAEHARWFADALGRADRRVFVVEADGVAAGTVRLDRAGREASVSISVAPEWRGRGVGTEALRLLCRAEAGEAGLERLVARVKPGNPASRAAFARAGFAVVEDDDPVLMARGPRPRVVAAVQARMGSQRLPGKVLRLLAGRPMLVWLIDRLRLARGPEAVVVATSVERRDDPIAELAAAQRAPCVRGSEVDLVARLLATARRTDAGALVRVTADCPFVDPAVVDALVATWRQHEGRVDVVVNNDPPSFPHGLDAEVIPLTTLERLDAEIADPYYREWFPYWWRERRGEYRIVNVPSPVDLSHHRWTVDYAEDLAFADRVFGALVPRRGRAFLMQDVVEFLDAHPEVAAINAAHAHR